VGSEKGKPLSPIRLTHSLSFSPGHFFAFLLFSLVSFFFLHYHPFSLILTHYFTLSPILACSESILFIFTHSFTLSPIYSRSDSFLFILTHYFTLSHAAPSHSPRVQTAFTMSSSILLSVGIIVVTSWLILYIEVEIA
jgi:hypothetical protein